LEFGILVIGISENYLIIAGSTHLKIVDSAGITNLSETFAILAGNFIR
jgi:hypothetical protein